MEKKKRKRKDFYFYFFKVAEFHWNPQSFRPVSTVTFIPPHCFVDQFVDQVAGGGAGGR